MFSRLRKRIWFDGYYRGLAEASETWTSIVNECTLVYTEPRDIRESILDTVTRELGESRIKRTPNV